MKSVCFQGKTDQDSDLDYERGNGKYGRSCHHPTYLPYRKKINYTEILLMKETQDFDHLDQDLQQAPVPS